ncbi:TPA: filamentous hemagglutinin N-terminal domain-containing protein [Campylobacter coli]|nr:filamentous hemagglutinin N-terminal domain-containing protein [Campylobacter coli]HEH5040478.1 filamentous hemagglutinin N-terminal domain-containing protein [Campylobacter coli]HEH5151497.1 filamentous hemagglutinin N-terminal domain-containing protein [Campylobacter coli]HEH5389230.1 filamentous hemagglutinin N-terminal domain-containing protein [Campylobacter coli]HEH5417773.1 filamentous hemagglutinin N-terminal domain-containing protein [Campylobacter coli]
MRKAHISIIASFCLANSLMAMPSGGKFVNAGGGNITTQGNTMNIAGNDMHNVIAWGGGFNISAGNTVNFTTNSKNYLNLDFTKNPSKILGTLNGGSNNIFLVNPSGVLIGTSGVINANKFIASTNPITNTEMKDFISSGKFSTKISAKGDIVNLGKINVNEITFAGNKVENLTGTLGGTNGQNGLPNQAYSNSIKIQGNNVYLNGDNITGKDIQAEVGQGGYFTHETGKYYDKYKSDYNLGKYTFSGKGLSNFKKHAYIGNASYNNNQMINAWIGFSESWNNSENFRNIGFLDFSLLKDINFNNALVNPVGEDYSNDFESNFYGNGHTLSNVKIDGKNEILGYIGLFGRIDNSIITDLNIDTLSFENVNLSYLGGFAAYINNSTISNISVKNIEKFASDYLEAVSAGGFATDISNSTISNITLENIGSIYGLSAGGFANSISSSEIKNISINNIKDIYGGSGVGGFAQDIEYSTLNNIKISGIDKIRANDTFRTEDVYVYGGGFAGEAHYSTISNITLNDIGTIFTFKVSDPELIYDSKGYLGGFVGNTYNGIFQNIAINGINSISSNNNAGGFAGYTNIADFSNIAINNIGSISSNYHVGGFAGYISNGNFNNIAINNIGTIQANNTVNTVYSAGFAGNIMSGTLNNIVLNNIGTIFGSGIEVSCEDSNGICRGGIGGFVGGLGISDNTASVSLSNITLNNVKNITGDGSTGGFVGFLRKNAQAKLSNITLNDIDSITATEDNFMAGGFIGSSKGGTFENIALNNIGSIQGISSAGGFVGVSREEASTFKDIVLNNIGTITATSQYGQAGGFAGDNEIASSYFNITLFLNASLNGYYKNLFSYYTSGITPTTSNINIYYTPSVGSTTISNGTYTGITATQLVSDTALNSQKGSFTAINNTTGIVEWDKNKNIFVARDKNSTMEYITGTNGNSYLHMLTNNKIGGADSQITFNKTSHIYELPAINTGSSGSNITTSPTLPNVINKGNLSQVTLTEGDFDKILIESILREFIDADYSIHLIDPDTITMVYTDINGKKQTITATIQELENNPSLAQSLAFLIAFDNDIVGELDTQIKNFETKYGEGSVALKDFINKLETNGVPNRLQSLANLISQINKDNIVLKEKVDNFNNLKLDYENAINDYNLAVREFNNGILKGVSSDELSNLKTAYEEAYNIVISKKEVLENLKLEIESDYAKLSSDYNQMNSDKDSIRVELNGLKLLEDKYYFWDTNPNANGTFSFSDKLDITLVDASTLELPTLATADITEIYHPYVTDPTNPSEKPNIENTIKDIIQAFLNADYYIHLSNTNLITITYYNSLTGQQENLTLDLKNPTQNSFTTQLSYILEFQDLNQDFKEFAEKYNVESKRLLDYLAKLEQNGIPAELQSLANVISQINRDNVALENKVNNFNHLKADYENAINAYNQTVEIFNNASSDANTTKEELLLLKANYENAYKVIEQKRKSLESLKSEIISDYTALKTTFDTMNADKDSIRTELGGLKLLEDKYKFGDTNAIANGTFSFSDKLEITSIDNVANYLPTLETGDKTTISDNPNPTIPDDIIIADKPQYIPTPKPEPEIPIISKPELPFVEQPSFDYVVDTKLDTSKYQRGLQQADDILVDGEYDNGEYTDGRMKKVICISSSNSKTHNPCLAY